MTRILKYLKLTFIQIYSYLLLFYEQQWRGNEVIALINANFSIGGNIASLVILIDIVQSRTFQTPLLLDNFYKMLGVIFIIIIILSIAEKRIEDQVLNQKRKIEKDLSKESMKPTIVSIVVFMPLILLLLIM